jgi:hypothetical protein
MGVDAAGGVQGPDYSALEMQVRFYPRELSSGAVYYQGFVSVSDPENPDFRKRATSVPDLVMLANQVPFRESRRGSYQTPDLADGILPSSLVLTPGQIITFGVFLPGERSPIVEVSLEVPGAGLPVLVIPPLPQAGSVGEGAVGTDYLVASAGVIPEGIILDVWAEAEYGGLKLDLVMHQSLEVSYLGRHLESGAYLVGEQNGSFARVSIRARQGRREILPFFADGSSFTIYGALAYEFDNE